MCTQEYLEPYLLDGFKFDMRLYVVLASVNPMRGYLCRVGMVRKAMVAYQEPDETNIKQLHMHLTNTSLNSKVRCAVDCALNSVRVAAVFSDMGVVASRALQFHADSSDDEDDEDEEEEEDEDDEDDDDDDDKDDSEDEEEDSDDEPADCKRFLSDVMEELKCDGVDTQALWQVLMYLLLFTPPLSFFSSPAAPVRPMQTADVCDTVCNKACVLGARCIHAGLFTWPFKASATCVQARVCT